MLQKEFSAHSKTLDSGQATTTTGENGSPTGSGMTEKKKIHLFWGLRHEEDIYLQEELEKLTEDRGLKTEDGVEKSTEFQYSIVLSQPKEDWAGDRGHVTEHVLEFAKANRQDYDWYLCGNNQMIKEVEEGLKVLGVPPEQMKKDAYY